MVEKTKKNLTGIIKGVFSGDHIAIHKSSKTGLPTEHQVYLSSIQAPKMGSTNRSEEPFGFAAREFLREKIIGKKCEFQLEYTYSARDYGILIVNEENINLQIVKAGLAKVVEKKGSMTVSKFYEDLVLAQSEAQKKHIGLWTTDERLIQKNSRNVTYFSDTGYNPNKILEDSKVYDKPLESIVEYVFSASFVSLYVIKFDTVVKLSMNHLFTPINTDKDMMNEGKLFTEKFILHRTVGVKFEKIEEGGILKGRIFHPAGDIAYEIVKNGFAKLNIPKNIDFDAEYYKTLKEAQLIAQTKRMRIWKNMKIEESKQSKPSTSDFTGKVVEVHSGDNVTIQRDSDQQLIRVFFTTVKAPSLAKRESDVSEPYAWESKEALRKQVIGKKVKVVMEYSRIAQSKIVGGDDRNMDFATLFLLKNNKNVSCSLLEKGLLKCNVSKSGDNASKYLEDLLASEKKAVDNKVGIHSHQAAPIRSYTDLTQNIKKAKSFESMVMQRGANRQLNGVIDYCFSGMRFKIRIDSESTYISFSILGIKTMANDKNQPQMLEFSNKAQQFARDTLLQRDVSIEIDFADKRGTFFGQLCLKNKQNYAILILQQGLAQINIIGNKAPFNLQQLENAEDKAKQENMGIWGENLKLMAKQATKYYEINQKLNVEITYAVDHTRFHVRIVDNNQYSKIEQELEEFDPEEEEDLEKPIKKGTLCAAKFSQDGNWYRGEVSRSLGKNEFEVYFIDFGNEDIVKGDDIKKLPETLMSYEPQSIQCQMADVRNNEDINFRQEDDEGDEEFQKQSKKFNKLVEVGMIYDAVVQDQIGDILSLVLFEKGEKEWDNSVNSKLIEVVEENNE